MFPIGDHGHNFCNWNKEIEIEKKLFANEPNSLHIYIKILVIINFWLLFSYFAIGQKSFSKLDL